MSYLRKTAMPKNMYLRKHSGFPKDVYLRKSSGISRTVTLRKIRVRSFSKDVFTHVLRILTAISSKICICAYLLASPYGMSFAKILDTRRTVVCERSGSDLGVKRFFYPCFAKNRHAQKYVLRKSAVSPRMCLRKSWISRTVVCERSRGQIFLKRFAIVTIICCYDVTHILIG